MTHSRLKACRVGMGLPIAAVAVRAGVGPGTIVMIERHGHVPKIETREKIAKALGVEVQAIWPGQGKTNPPSAA